MFRTWRLRPSRSVMTSVAPLASRFIGSSVTSDARIRRPSITSPRCRRSRSCASGMPRTRRLVDARDAVAGMREPRRGIAVIHQQQQPFRFVVETPDRIDGLLHAAQQVDDRLAPLRIRPRRRRSRAACSRECQRCRSATLTREPSTRISSRDKSLWSRAPDGFAVHRHASVEHHLLGGAPRGDTRLGEDLLETFRSPPRPRPHERLARTPNTRKRSV